MKNKKDSSYLKTIDFADHKTGLYDTNTFSNDWDNARTNKGEIPKGISERRGRIVKINNEKVLQFTIPKNSLSDGGFFWRLNLPKGLEDVTFEYGVMFGNNFNFVRGGKLPGLAGGTAPGGGSKDKNGFSARLMWRAATSYEELCHLVKDLKLSNKRDINKPYLVQYTYYPDKQTRKWGKDFVYMHKNKKIFLKPSKWYNIKMQIKLAKDSKKKDTIVSWVNGKEVLKEKLKLRKNKNYGVDQVMFSLFFGGNEQSWATKKKENVYFRRFVIKGE